MEKENNEDNFHVYEAEIDDEEITHYDVVVLGGGPAGLTSAIYSSRYGLYTALITKDIGGMATKAHKIENYPGFEGSGQELMQKFYKQAKKHGSQFLHTEVADLHKDETGFIIELQDGKVVHSRSLIMALGTEKRKLNIPGEDKFIGRGISYCATCDAAFFKGKEVAVIGGRNSAAKAALLLSNLAKNVYIVYRQDRLNCDKADKEKVEEKDNIELILNSTPKEVKGEERVEKLVIEQEEEEKELGLDGVFIEIGSVPVQDLTNQLGIETDKEGYIKANNEMETNVPGIFAAGDTIKSPIKQVVIAAGQGALAAFSAKEYLSKKQ